MSILTQNFISRALTSTKDAILIIQNLEDATKVSLAIVFVLAVFVLKILTLKQLKLDDQEPLDLVP